MQAMAARQAQEGLSADCRRAGPSLVQCRDPGVAPECLSGFGRSAVHRPVEGSDRCRLRSVCRGSGQGQDLA